MSRLTYPHIALLTSGHFLLRHKSPGGDVWLLMPALPFRNPMIVVQVVAMAMTQPRWVIAKTDAGTGEREFYRLDLRGTADPTDPADLGGFNDACAAAQVIVPTEVCYVLPNHGGPPDGLTPWASPAPAFPYPDGAVCRLVPFAIQDGLQLAALYR